jgi:Trypsin
MAGGNDEHVGGTTTALRFGADDVDTPEANAVVWLGGCTGTLLAESIAVTAGHCFAHGAGVGRWDAGLPCSDKEVPGRWYPIEQEIDVRIGNDRTDARFTTRATEYSIPGCADVFLVRFEEPVPRTNAIPAKVLVSAGPSDGARDAGFLRGQTLVLVGWGRTETGATPRIRQVGNASYVRNDDEKVYVRGSGSTITASGDSGGPLFWDSRGRRLLVGILQGPIGAVNENKYTPTFRRPIGGKPGVGEFFRELVPTAVLCDDALGGSAGTVPLVAWWSPDRRDNFLTSDPRWIGCVGTVRSPDYVFVRTEGFVFNPTLPQPPGTVRLFSWYSRERGDNYATTHPRWIYWDGGGRSREPGYGFVRLEGYVFDPSRPQPSGTVPVYSWYSGSRGDNWTSAAFESEGRAGTGLEPDYGEPLLMGYIHPPR